MLMAFFQLCLQLQCLLLFLIGLPVHELHESVLIQFRSADPFESPLYQEGSLL